MFGQDQFFFFERCEAEGGDLLLLYFRAARVCQVFCEGLQRAADRQGLVCVVSRGKVLGVECFSC